MTPTLRAVLRNSRVSPHTPRPSRGEEREERRAAGSGNYRLGEKCEAADDALNGAGESDYRGPRLRLGRVYVRALQLRRRFYIIKIAVRDISATRSLARVLAHPLGTAHYLFSAPETSFRTSLSINSEE